MKRYWYRHDENSASLGIVATGDQRYPQAKLCIMAVTLQTEKGMMRVGFEPTPQCDQIPHMEGLEV